MWRPEDSGGLLAELGKAVRTNLRQALSPPNIELSSKKKAQGTKSTRAKLQCRVLPEQVLLRFILVIPLVEQRKEASKDDDGEAIFTLYICV